MLNIFLFSWLYSEVSEVKYSLGYVWVVDISRLDSCFHDVCR